MIQTKAVELSLVKDPGTEINELHQKICLAARTTVEDAIRVGELLAQQHKVCPHGGWLSWLKENVKFSDTTARKYQRVYENRAKFELSSNLTDAYRIALPKKDKPKHNKKVAPLVLKLVRGARAM